MKSDRYYGYYYIATHVEDIIITAKNSYKYMNEIEQHFQVRNITDSPDYYLVNELVKVRNKMHVSSKKYVKKILRGYQGKHGDLKKELLPLKVKEHPELGKTSFLVEKVHK